MSNARDEAERSAKGRSRLAPLRRRAVAGLAVLLLLGAQQARAQAMPAAPSPGVSPVIEINLATEAELDAIRGAGPAMTRALMAARARQPFTDWQDLIRRVKGVGPSRARQWSADGVRVNGTVYPPP